MAFLGSTVTFSTKILCLSAPLFWDPTHSLSAVAGKKLGWLARSSSLQWRERGSSNSTPKTTFFLQKPPMPPCPSPNVHPSNITSVFQHVCPQHENMCKVPPSFGCVSEKMVTKTQRGAARQPGGKRVSDCRWEDRRGEVGHGRHGLRPS